MRYYSLVLSILLFSCSDSLEETVPAPDLYTEIKKALSINPVVLDNYAAQGKPAYVNKDNTAANPISDKTATLGRVLFYDKNLSVNNTISCASCHKQEFAFGDTAISSVGVDNGRTERHSMRLINTRYANEAFQRQKLDLPMPNRHDLPTSPIFLAWRSTLSLR
jgi:cytochrome c peroxidase